jgi:uncharacterized protein
MFGWFQRLLPRSSDFFDMFERHVAAIVAAADALASLTRGEGEAVVHLQIIRDREHEADEVIREVLGAVRGTFLTPFDRGAITSLIGAMDDTIDEVQAAASAIEIYDIKAFSFEMQGMAAAAVQAISLMAEAMPLLRDVERNGRRLHELTGQIVALEGEVDMLHEAGLKRSYQSQRETPEPIGFIVTREIYKHLERIADAFEDVANEIDSLVVAHA